MIYLVTCCTCNIQYVVETALTLHKRIHIHRTAKSGCEYMIKHFRNNCDRSSFSIQLFETFKGKGYVNYTVCPIARYKRLEREVHWLKTMRTEYSYSRNDRASGEDTIKLVVSQFPSISRGKARTARTRTASAPTDNTDDAIFEQIYLIIDNDIKNACFHICVILNTVKKNLLKQLAVRILYRINDHSDLKQNLDQYYIYTLDITDSKDKRHRTKTSNRK